MESPHYEPRPGNGRSNGRSHAHRTTPSKSNGKSRVPACPYCHDSGEVIPIVYGFPTHAMFLKADRGELFLGGCDISPYNYYCKRDDREF